MVNINLLPWRQENLAKEKRIFIIELIICLIITILLAILIHSSYSKKINRQLHHNTVLQKEMRAITPKVQALKKYKKIKATLEKQINTLQELQYIRYQTVTLFNEITQLMPQGIFINRFLRKKNIITLQGQAKSHLLISELLKKIDLSRNLFVPTLSNIITEQSKADLNITKFELSLQLKPYEPLFEGGTKK